MINLNTPNKLPSKIRWYWLTKIIILIFLISFLFSLAFSLINKNILSTLFIILIIFISFPVFSYLLLLLYYNSLTFVVEDTKITINSGVIIKHSKSIPFNIIQNVENVRGILHRIFGISRVKIWTASPEQIQAYKGSTTHKPDGILDLTVEDGNWLKNFILEKHS
jgi:hypothetical protein